MIFTDDPAATLSRVIAGTPHHGAMVVTDTSVARHVINRMNSVLTGIAIHIADEGDINKTIDGVSSVWQAMIDNRLTRHSLLINIGGGMVTDMGGFAASTFKRGIRFINVPTSLLGAVDAATGGKTGINFGNLKNEIGLFRPADEVIVSTTFFNTLNHCELLSGYAEMIKHSLLTSEKSLASLLACDPSEITLNLLRESIAVKERIVALDPGEKGIRKALNLGHTAGHAFETLALRRGKPIPHGYAVATGLVVETVLSRILTGFPSELMYTVASAVRCLYGEPTLRCADYDELLELMAHDKKNRTTREISFTLLANAGEPHTDIIVERDDIIAALDIARDLLSA